jgi:hypothetical protein
MLSSDYQALKLICIYFTVSELYENELCYVSQRFTNNSEPEFTDQEAMTIYLYAMSEEERFTILQIYKLADRYLRSWFPLLPSYVAFNKRINRLGEAFRTLSGILLSSKIPAGCRRDYSLLDSMPIITCSGKRSPKVALELTDKSFCSTKNLFYHGLKLHALAFHKPKGLPHPESFVITPASENDLNVFKQNWAGIQDRTFWGDKIYHDNPFFDKLAKENNSTMYTPVKGIKDMPDILKHWDRAANDLFSRAVSRIRQPIESLFNWLIQKTDIQRASKVRSSKGLIVHVFGRIAAAFIGLIFDC